MKKILLTLLGIAAFASTQAQVYPLVPIDSVQYVSPALLSATPPVTVSPNYNGDTVRIRGVVMFNPRQSALSANFKNTYLAVPGATTGFKGVNVRLATLADSTTTQFFDNVQLGNIVEITGKVAHFPATTNGETQIDLIAVPTSVVSVSTPNAPIAKNIGDFAITTAGVSAIQYLTGEQYEGMYVEFQNVSIVDVVQTGTAPATRFRWSVQDAAGNKIGIRDISIKYRNTAAQPNNISASTATTPNPAATVYLQQGKSFAYIRGTITKLFIAASGIYEYQLVPLTSSDLGPVTASPPVITTITTSNPVPTSTNAVTITANITDLDGTVSSTNLRYAVGLANNTFVTVPMTLTTGSIYTATIPAQANNSFVKFYVRATDNQNNVSNFPDTLATNSYYKVLDAGITKISDIQQTPNATGASIYAGKTIGANMNIRAKIISTSASNDLGIITLQDGTTPYSGIFALSGANSPAFDTAVRGDSILITAATIIENFGVTQLQDVTATLVTATNCNTTSIKPNIDSVLALTRNATEALEGMLVEFNNVQVVKVNADAPNGNFGEFSFYTTATGNGVRADDLSNEIIPTFNIDSLTTGLPLGYVKGIMYFAFGNWKILPRNLKDIQGFYSTYECIGVSTNEISKDVFEIETIYPNPSSSQINIGLILKSANTVRISCVDILGKTVSTETRNMERGEYRLQHDISPLTTGVYVVKVQVNGYTQAFRLVKN